MHAQNITVLFDDAPEMEEVAAVLSGWQIVKPLEWGQRPGREGVAELAGLVREKFSRIESRQKGQLELEVIDWLYDFLRANVKRGRVFDLREVLPQSHADCLGYAKLFTLLGRLFGLDVGVIEIVIDNAGRYVPHTACLVRLADGCLRFVDLWYGSKNIQHRRVGLRVKRGGSWKINDLELEELKGQEQVSYLPDPCVNGITRYILGNRYLNRREFDNAIRCYSEAISLYPENARFFYNRAIAYESQGERERAAADYAQALHDEAALIRILATEHDEVVGLIDLDAWGITSPAQDIYLLYKGFVTGSQVTPAKIAKRLGLSEAETKAILSSVEAKLAGSG